MKRYLLSMCLIIGNCPLLFPLLFHKKKNIRERDYNEALFTLNVFNNRELSPVVPPCCSPVVPPVVPSLQSGIC